MEETNLAELNRLRKAIELMDVGVWQWDMVTDEEKWSDQYYRILGYEPGELQPELKTFIDFLLHTEDVEKVNTAVKAHLEDGRPYRVPIRMRMKTGEFRWFLSSGNAINDEKGEPVFMAGTIVDIDEEIAVREKLERNEMFFEETGRLAQVGGWEVNLIDNTLKWSKTIYDIHELPYTENVDVERAIGFYKPEDAKRISKDLEVAIKEGSSFSNTYQIVTAKGNSKYVQSVGSTVKNEQGQVVKVRGIFQDIDERKRAQLLMEETLAVATEQNEKLINFAHIVSHNLRNHSSNLEMLVNFVRESTDPEDRVQLLDKIDQVTNNLSETIDHLNEVVRVENAVDKNIEKINLTDAVLKTLDILTGELRQIGATCNHNLPKEKYVYFTPAYLDSIILNLLSNAIRYRHPDRSLEITITLRETASFVKLSIADNGLGIDLNRYRDRIFRMYSTFHSHPEARGVGLFISKSQVESLGGSIDVESVPDKGTTFTVSIPVIDDLK
ncbi:sensor histidine kinase [Phaeocystidibacter luteus]|uniref:histidine kinase n=1 Tax=Phaeocystidibacter luteus TaxID=911197 RepID=A0A6N6RL48_9FLAO|nr:PAS domain-containing sensor histidine kinase [Phaeocystidibacter luteus]KAB2813602.1 PAS domain-containing protein [Phaeocystidibacter luteus]